MRAGAPDGGEAVRSAQPENRLRRDAPALRFLLLSLGTWVAFRILVQWDPTIPSQPAAAPWPPPPPFAAPPWKDDFAATLPVAAQAMPLSRKAAEEGSDAPIPTTEWADFDGGAAIEGSDTAFTSDRHRLRYALMARLFPGASNAAAVPSDGAAWLAPSRAALAPVGQGQPYWMNRELARWSLGSWLYLRDGSAPGAIATGGQLGGSQAGVRLAYGFGDGGRTRVYGRATIAIERPRQRELAFGLAFAPVRGLPVDIAVEQRVAAGRDGRTALAALASGGVSDVAMPWGFRLEAYAQAGIVGARRRDGFADGAVVVDHRLGREERSPLRLGALAAGAVQPGAARVDVGPRLTFKIPDVGQGARIALDWRQRVAGDARPESGLALTLAADF